MTRGEKMSEQLSNEIRNFMEQKNQTLVDQIEKSNQTLLQALQNMGNSINNFKTNNSGGKYISSNHSENSVKPIGKRFIGKEKDIRIKILEIK